VFVERFEDMMMFDVYRLEPTVKFAMFASPVTFRETTLATATFSVRTFAFDKKAVPETLRLVTLVVERFEPDVTLSEVPKRDAAFITRALALVYTLRVAMFASV
jgi:hypothetical protein